MNRDKLLGLQVLRGLAAWIVVFHHVNQTFFNWEPPLKILYVFNHGGFGVDIFFVLSGFIMFYSVKNNSRGGVSFFLDRFFRIFPVYWCMTLLLLISGFLFSASSYDTYFTKESLAKSLLLITSKNPNGGFYPYLYVGWTLIYEMFFYIVLSISLLIYKSRALIITTVFLFFFPLILKSNDLLGNSNYLLYEFLIGISIAFVFSHLEKSRYSKALLKSIYAVPIFLICFGCMYFMKSSLFLRSFNAALLVVAFLLLEIYFKKYKSVFWVQLGDISYSTYLIHPIIYGWFILLFRSVNSLIFKCLIIFMALYLVFLLSKFSYKYIEINRRVLDTKKHFKTSLLNLCSNN